MHAPKMKRNTRAIAIAGVLTFAAAGGAFAYWTHIGGGTGTAVTGTNAAVTVNQTSSIIGLYPGQTQTLSGDFTNPNAGATWVTPVTATGYVIDPVHVSAGCAISGNYTLGGADTLAARYVAAGGPTGSWTGLTITMNDLAGTNQDACKGATLTITYAIS